jgi:hypothetical protein
MNKTIVNVHILEKGYEERFHLFQKHITWGVEREGQKEIIFVFCLISFFFLFLSSLPIPSPPLSSLPLRILLPQPPEYWDYRCAPPCPSGNYF